MFFYVYILKSTVEKRYYIGSTENVEGRLAFHNSNRARWTKRYQPWVLEHVEEFQTRSEAVKRERFLKSLKGIGRNLEKIKLGEL
jgi:putative endonuclease